MFRSVRAVQKSTPLQVSRIAATLAQSNGLSTQSSTIKRPVSPHLSIYQPQLTWYMSGLHRFTGGVLATGFYAGAIAYLAIPGFDTSSIVSVASSLPLGLKILGKGIVAFPTTYHTFNGIRHLVWDAGYCLSLKSVYTSGYLVVGATALSTLGLMAL